jgi:stalled ribosome rescue protein Dom34
MAGSESFITSRDAKDYVVVNAGERYDPAGFAKQRKKWAKESGADLEKFIKVAADSIEQLRKVDVLRVLESNGSRQKELARYITAKRPDLAQEVKECMEDIGVTGWMAKSLSAPFVRSVRQIT